MPLEASSRTVDCQLNGLLWTPDLLFFRSLCHTPSFVPELHIRWFVTSVRWSAHCCELPHTCFTADQVFLFLADLEHFVPVHWAWTSSELRFPDVTEYVVHESAWIQYAILIEILHNLVSALSIEWTLWNDLAALTHDRRLGDDSRLIVCGPVGSLWRAIPKAAPDQITIRWVQIEWPGKAQEPLRLLGFWVDKLWTLHRTCKHDGQALSLSRRSAQCPEYGHIFPPVCSVWQGQFDAVDVAKIQNLEPFEADRRGHSIPQADPFPDLHPGVDHEGGQLQLDRKDDALVNSLITKGMITSDLQWQYLAWDAKAMTLKSTKQEAISSTEMISILQRLQTLSANPHLVHRFATLRPLKQNTIPQDGMKAAPWKLEISLRSAEANELHALIQSLSQRLKG